MPSVDSNVSAFWCLVIVTSRSAMAEEVFDSCAGSGG